MSAQIIELLILAVVAFVLVNRLMSVLGTTNDTDGTDESFFGESFGIKDVTGQPAVLPKNTDLEDLIVKENFDSVVQTLPIINSHFPGFDIVKFVSGSKAAFGMIVNAINDDKNDVIEALVDKRFISNLMAKKDYYKIPQDGNLDAKITELYLFGNSVFIKLLLSRVHKKSDEIWTFTKNSNDRSSNWFLCNIEAA